MVDPTTLFLFDNGAHSIKLSNLSDQDPTIHRNAIIKSKTDRRTYVGNQLEECNDYGGLNFKIPFEKGVLTNWDTQKTIWDHVFSSSQIDPSNSTLFLTHPPLLPSTLLEGYDQMIFEEYEFSSYARSTSAAWVAAGENTESGKEAVLVVDTGFSKTDITPVLAGRVVPEGVRRIEIGGKLLTNYLKELLSFRQWYMMDQTSVVENVKEKAAFVSTQFNKDWERTRPGAIDPSIVRTYVLPDFVPSSSNKLGYLLPSATSPSPPSSPPPHAHALGADEFGPTSKGKGKAEETSEEKTGNEGEKAEEQLMQLANERFTVPEVLFEPGSIGLNQLGLPAAIAASIEALPEELRGMFWANIVVHGGNAKFRGFEERLRTELRSLCPVSYSLGLTISPTPTLQPLLSAKRHLVRHFESPTAPSVLMDNLISRAEYQEIGGGLGLLRKRWGEKRERGTGWSWEKGEIVEWLKND